MFKYLDSIDTTLLKYIKEHAKGILESYPKSYIKAAKLHGTLFDPDTANGLISSVDTRSRVDHMEPGKALICARDVRDWRLGDLREGHEFHLIVKDRWSITSDSSLDLR